MAHKKYKKMQQQMREIVQALIQKLDKQSRKDDDIFRFGAICAIMGLRKHTQQFKQNPSFLAGVRAGKGYYCAAKKRIWHTTPSQDVIHTRRLAFYEFCTSNNIQLKK